MVAATTLVDAAGETFERLFAREYHRVVSIAFRITGDASDAEDVAQDVFVRFSRSRRMDGDRARGWLYTAAAHTALNVLRSKRRRLRRELHLEPVVDASDPQAIVVHRDERARVRAALLRIGAREAEMLALRYSGLSYREVASALGIDPAQVGTRLARAERALKREIERDTLG